MSKTSAAVNPQGIASLKNVAIALDQMERLVNRAQHLPGLGVMSGPSGIGKTRAMSVVAVKFRAVHVECRSYFTKKSFLEFVLHEMAIRPGRTVAEMVDQICEQLMKSQLPLILDDFDNLVERNLVELVRDIHEGSQAPILMVGEEMLPRKLKRWERFDNRVLTWALGQPCDLEDARKLAKLYCDVPVEDEWLRAVLKVARSVTRRVSVNLDDAREEAKKLGKKSVSLDWWGDRPFYTGEAPERRPT